MESYIGMIALFPFNFVPSGWHACDGSLLPIAQNQALFSLLGTAFGGNGQTNFALPDLRGKSPIGVSGEFPLGSASGSNTVAIEPQTLTIPAPVMVGDEPPPAPTEVVVAKPAPALNVQNPSLALQWAICLQGIYPSRH